MEQKKIALFPGSFDPITLGHVNIIERTLPLVDCLYIGIGVNTTKATLFSIQQRTQWLERLFESEPKVEVVSYQGLTVDLCREIGARYIVRGLRGVTDFEYERTIADMNTKLFNEMETLFLISAPEYSSLSSTIIREIIKNGGDVSSSLPGIVWKDIQNRGRILI